MSFLKGLLGPSARITAAGSFRRARRETVGDVSTSWPPPPPEEVVAAFVRMPLVEEVLAKGPAKSQRHRQGHHPGRPEDRGAQVLRSILQYFTGCQGHDVHPAQIALDRGYSLSEYSP